MNYDISDVTYHEIVDQYSFKTSYLHIYNIYGLITMTELIKLVMRSV